MIRNNPVWSAVMVAMILVVLVSVFGTSPALAARDRTVPTKPANLRVTSTTSYNVSLAWHPSTDNSGHFSYRVVVSDGATYIVPQTQTTFSVFVAPVGTYSFYVFAVDGSGNKSQRSNTVSATPPPDTTAPTPPVVSVTGVNPTEVSLAWTASTDDGPYLFYQVYVNGSPNVDAGQNRFAVVQGLTPETTYEITVKAREINLFWTESVDNQTAQADLVYEVYMNGVLDHTTSGDRTILYATQAGENTFTVIAVDEAGNRSEPASITIVSQ